jgi:SAM-dependent methyltransferase
MTERKRTESYWSANDSYAAASYYRFAPVIDRYAKKVFGVTADGRADWLEKLLTERYFSEEIPFGRVLSLCCGFGHVERALSRTNFGVEIHGIDLSRTAVERAITMAREEGLNNISYNCQDINNLSLFENEWDVIYVSGGLHHLINVNRVVETIREGLRMGGYFVAYDKIGPKFQNPSMKEMEILDAVMHLMPIEFRPQFKIKKDNTIKGYLEDFAKKAVNRRNKRTKTGRVYFAPPPLYWRLVDPSEGVGSALVYGAITRHFPQCKFFPLNGGVLSYLIGAGFLQSYDPTDKAHEAFLDALFALEDSLTELGRIRCVDALFIGQKT